VELPERVQGRREKKLPPGASLDGGAQRLGRRLVFLLSKKLDAFHKLSIEHADG
jgi:hypothetical protein